MNIFKRIRVPIEDEEIIDLYWNRDERAIEETDIKYHKYLFAITASTITSRAYSVALQTAVRVFQTIAGTPMPLDVVSGATVNTVEE